MMMRKGLAVVVAMVGLAATSAAQPKLVVKENIDLGTVYNGDIVKAQIVLTNAGTDHLVIQSVRTSCGCTTVRQPHSELAAGQSDTAEVEFNSAGFRGEVTKYVHFETNDPINPYVSVTFKTNVLEILEPTNRFSLLWFGDLKVGREASLTYTLKNISSSKISIHGVKKVYPKLMVAYDKKTVAPGDSVVVTVSVTPNKGGYFNEAFTLETDSKKQPHVPIRVSYVGSQR